MLNLLLKLQMGITAPSVGPGRSIATLSILPVETLQGDRVQRRKGTSPTWPFYVRVRKQWPTRTNPLHDEFTTSTVEFPVQLN